VEIQNVTFQILVTFTQRSSELCAGGTGTSQRYSTFWVVLTSLDTGSALSHVTFLLTPVIILFLCSLDLTFVSGNVCYAGAAKLLWA
jgi:hypothetical protein